MSETDLNQGDERAGGGWPAELALPLRGELVALEPLRLDHADGLWQAAQGEEIWAWITALNGSREEFDHWLETSVAATRAGSEGAFAVRQLASGELIGSSRFLNVRPTDRVVEIGWTWFNPRVWRSGVNIETKLLLMTHAFETLGCVRVELKTDARNERSRGAMAALPAHFEGVLRNHMIVPGIGLRDSAYYSVIDSEWPAVRANLERRLRRSTI
ncbi:MAG: GNAT family N-acetyltransferase [Actinobacteria bacterium]|nr:GNAT family N-acetyltransferase [Actinomycetota bacterium]